MFMLCDAMKWSHLPIPGGIYAQDPAMLDKFLYIFAERAKQQEKDHKQHEAKMKASTNKGSFRGRRR